MDRIKEALQSLGYIHFAVAASPDCHVLPASQPSHPGERMQVLIASKWRFSNCEAVPFPESGNAAYAELEGLSFGVYCAHFSVRGPPEQRLGEAEALLTHRKIRALKNVVIGGDFNQPSQRDYPVEEWMAIAQDLENCGLPLSDGVADRLNSSGFRSSFAHQEWPPGSSAWNGCLVDYLYSSLSSWKVAGSWLWFASCSDHLPVVADYAMV